LEKNDNDSSLKYCGNCGKNLMPNATFCAYCGAKIPKLAEISGSYDIIHELGSSLPQTTPLRPFITNFQGVLLSPKEEIPQVINTSNLSQPLYLNIFIGLLVAIALLTYFSKMPISLSQSFLDSFPGMEDLNPSEFINLFNQLMLLFTPIAQILNWLLYSLVLWILVALFASDIVPRRRNFRTIASIAGWSQIPVLFQQLVMIGYNLLILPRGEIIFHSVFEIETRVLETNSLIEIFDFILLGIEFFILLWSIFLIYYAVKSLGSMKSNTSLICIVYAIIIFFMPAFTGFI
jgi:hypothetical protein